MLVFNFWVSKSWNLSAFSPISIVIYNQRHLETTKFSLDHFSSPPSLPCRPVVALGIFYESLYFDFTNISSYTRTLKTEERFENKSWEYVFFLKAPGLSFHHCHAVSCGKNTISASFYIILACWLQLSRACRLNKDFTKLNLFFSLTWPYPRL